MIGIALTLALASAQFSMSNGGPRTSATTCDALYYGLGQAPDPAAAYRCYGEDGDLLMQIVLTLNGDGVTRDPQRVQTLLDALAQKDPYDERRYGKTIREALASLRAGALDTRLVFCNGVAITTLDGIRCDSIRQFQLKVDATRQLELVAATLSAAQKAAFQRLREAADAFVLAEGGRAFQAFIEGTIRNSAGAAQEDYAREHFMSHVKHIFIEHALPAGVDGGTRVALEKELNDVYEKDLATHEIAERDIIGVGSGYRKATEETKHAWQAYRQAWVSMIMTLPFSGLRPSDAAQTMDLLLTRERTEELRHNILGVH